MQNHNNDTKTKTLCWWNCFITTTTTILIFSSSVAVVVVNAYTISNVPFKNSQQRGTFRYQQSVRQQQHQHKQQHFQLYSATTASSQTSRTNSLPEGMVKTIIKEGTGPLVRLGDIATVQYACYVIGEAIPFARSTNKVQKMMIGDNSMISSFDKTIRSMRIGEHCTVQVTDPSLGYGVNGIPPIVPPNAQIQLDIKILDAQPVTANIDFDQLAEADNTPRTASDIAAAFALRNQQRALEPELEGLDWAIAKVKSFYFFGLFEGETGERAPWFLRPSITFPIAFVIVGAAFYVSYVGGAISERGAQSTDELDEIILSSNLILNTISLAFLEK